MARGRKPETAEQQALKGAPGKRMSQKAAQAIRTETKTAAPSPIVIGNVRPPKWLKRSRKATEIWNDLAPRLAKLNLVSELDAVPLGRYCRYIVEWIAADLAVQKEGTWFDTVGTNGEPTKKRHPAWQACQDLEKMLRETEAAFGMRPDTRYKIMRDQALSHGVLPLFERNSQSEQPQPAATPTATPSPEDDPIGFLAGFDSRASRPCELNMPIAETSAAAIAASAGHLLWPEPQWVLDAVARGWEWARVQWRRAASQAGAWFDERKADAAVALFPRIFRLTLDRFAGKPFRLTLWQEVIVRLLVGWKIPVEIVDDEQSAPHTEQVRLFRRLLLWVPRKNGKSEFLAALALLFFILDGVVGGEGYAFARDEKQGKIVFDKMKAMLAMSPALADKGQAFKKSIWIPKIRAMFELLSGKPEGKHGRSPTVIVGDEMHEWHTAELANTLRQGTGARLEPIELYASTSGLKTNQTGWALWEESNAILDGRIDDPTSLVVIFAVDQEADWRDESIWSLANPSLGISPTMQFLRREAALAADNPRAEAHFRCYHLNQWIDAVTRWLNLKKWDACTADKTGWQAYAVKEGEDFGEKMRAAGLAGRRCYGAFDISSTDDITALVWAFPPDSDNPKWKLVCRFWVPEESIKRRVKNDRVSYDRWQKLCAITPTPGDYVDQDYVKRAVLEGLEAFDVAAIGYDSWNATKLYTDLVKDGAPEDLFLKMRQGHQTLGEPTKFFESLVSFGKLDHGGNPVMRWMAGNTAVRFDENLNFVPTKKRSAEKIDGIVAAIMACGLAISAEEPVDLDEYLRGGVMAA